MLPSIQDLRFRIEAGTIDLPLTKPAGDSDREGLRAPKLGTSRIHRELELKPLRELAVRELLSNAQSGTAEVIIPLREATLKKGPLKVRIPEGTKIVIRIVVRDGHIIREQANGNFEPPIDLPLGLEFRGIFLDDDGAIMADISPFPDIDLSWLKRSLRVPETLTEVLSMIFPDKDATPSSEAKGNESSTLGIIAKDIVVTAENIRPWQTPIDLGPFGHLALGPATRLSAEFGPALLRVFGHVDVREASVRGRGFSAERLSGTGQVEFVLHRDSAEQFYSVQCQLDRFRASEAEVGLVDGAHAALTNVEAQGTEISVLDKGEVEWTATAESLTGQSREGLFFAHIEGQQHQISLGASSFTGSLGLSNDHYDIDVRLDELEVSIGEHPLPLGIMHFDVVGSTAQIMGRLILNSDSGYHFDGSISTKSTLSGGHFDLGPAQGVIRNGTQLLMEISSLEGKRRLSRLVAKGSASVLLHSATLDLGEKSLGLSQGATGALIMHSIELQKNKQWPSVRAALELTTEIDPTTLDGVLELSGMQIHLSSPSVELTDEGHLCLGSVCLVGDPGPA